MEPDCPAVDPDDIDPLVVPDCGVVESVEVDPADPMEPEPVGEPVEPDPVEVPDCGDIVPEEEFEPDPMDPDPVVPDVDVCPDIEPDGLDEVVVLGVVLESLVELDAGGVVLLGAVEVPVVPLEPVLCDGVDEVELLVCAVHANAASTVIAKTVFFINKLLLGSERLRSPKSQI